VAFAYFKLLMMVSDNLSQTGAFGIFVGLAQRTQHALFVASNKIFCLFLPTCQLSDKLST
jgi:hypothetical protein